MSDKNVIELSPLKAGIAFSVSFCGTWIPLLVHAGDVPPAVVFILGVAMVIQGGLLTGFYQMWRWEMRVKRWKAKMSKD